MIKNLLLTKSDQIIFTMGASFVILAIILFIYTLKHPKLGAEGKHKWMRICLFVSIGSLNLCGIFYILYFLNIPIF